MPGFNYLGGSRYLLTICCEMRRPVFTESLEAHSAEALLIDSAARHGFAIIAYCFMPDHLHALVEGEHGEAAFLRFVRHFKQVSSYEYRRSHSGRLWQAGYHEHVLRSDEASAAAARYVLENPVRAGFVSRFEEYAFSGSTRYRMTELVELWRDKWRS